MREAIDELFPEINQINDPTLRDKVIAVWGESITRGGWTPEELKTIPFTLLAGKINMYFVEHVRSCAQMCLEIEKVLKRIWGDRLPVHHDHLLAGWSRGGPASCSAIPSAGWGFVTSTTCPTKSCTSWPPTARKATTCSGPSSRSSSTTPTSSTSTPPGPWANRTLRRAPAG